MFYLSYSIEVVTHAGEWHLDRVMMSGDKLEYSEISFPDL